VNVQLARPHPTASGMVGSAPLVLVVNYNQSPSVPEAIRRVQLLDEEALVWVEEPTRADDFAGHARIAAECRTPIQIGENFWGPHDLAKSLSAGASDFVMLDVMKIGGITGWLGAVSQVRAAGLAVSSHLFPELSAQLLAVCLQPHWLEYQDWAAPSCSDFWKSRTVLHIRRRKPAVESRGTRTQLRLPASLDKHHN
jgi:L-alanine-DL-glutamate epimerase-like enolase superfamily enzyme